METIKKILPLCYVLISSALLPANAEPGATVPNPDLLPAELQLDKAMIAAINQCFGADNDFTQRYQAVARDKQLLQQEADEITTRKEAIAASKANVDKEEGVLNEFAKAQIKMAGELETLRKGLYKHHATKPLSSEALIIENEKIQVYNKKSGEHNVMTDQYNNLVIAQKKRIAGHNALVASLNELVAGYNTHSLATQAPTNQLLRDVASYQGKCAMPKQAETR